MSKTEGRRLEREIKDLGIAKSHFALFAQRTPVTISGYIAGYRPIPEWIWLVVEEAKSLSAGALEKKVTSLRKAAKKS